VDVNRYVLVQGTRQTRTTLARWNATPWPVLRQWIGTAIVVAAGLLAAVWFIASIAAPSSTLRTIPGITQASHSYDVFPILLRNAGVLALHAVACLAAFIAGNSLALSPERRSGLSRVAHQVARPIAIAWVVAVTVFSLVAQAYALGQIGATLAYQLHISPGLLVLTVLPHALPELTAVFLPLAAWSIASRKGEWGDLLAATGVTVAIAVPLLIFAATWEICVWPLLLRAASPMF
jgi:Stage II sporulation protein M